MRQNEVTQSSAVTRQGLPSHEYRAKAHLLSGQLTRPIVQRIEEQGLVSLRDKRGGHFTRYVDSVSVEGLMSFRSGHTSVSGSFSQRHGFVTLSTAVIEGLNVFEVLTAERVVAQISTEHSDNKDARPEYLPGVTFLGTQFVNLRVAGCAVQVEMDLGICGGKPRGDRSYLEDNDFLSRVYEQLEKIVRAQGLPDSLKKEYETKLANVDDLIRHSRAREETDRDRHPRLHCSLIKSIGPIPIPGARTLGNLIILPDFGVVSLADVEVGIDPGYDESEDAAGSFRKRISNSTYFILSMLRMRMGSIGEADATAVEAFIGGSSTRIEEQSSQPSSKSAEIEAAPALKIENTNEQPPESASSIGGRPAGSDEPPELPVYPSIDPDPEHVVQNHLFQITVSLQREPSAATPGEVHLPPGRQHTLDVHLLLEANSAWGKLVWSRSRGTVRPARFSFVAPYIGARPDGTVPDRVYVALAANFYLNGRWCGEGLRNIEVLLNGDLVPSDAIQPPKTPLWSRLLNLEHGADPPDLLVRIQNVGGEMYEWTLLSPHVDLRSEPGSGEGRKQLGDGAHRFVRTNFDRAAGIALEDTLIPVIEARCREIYESTPDSFKDAYWKLYAAGQKESPATGRRKRSGGTPPRLKSIQFISDEPYVPWELMIVREDSVHRNPGRLKEEILSIRHAVGRWTAKASGQLRQRIGVQGMEVFASDYKDVDEVEPKLPWVVEERGWLKKQYDAHLGDLRFQPVMEFLRGGGNAQAIHFSCHGEMNVELPTESALWLEDFRKFVTAYVATEEVREGVGREHPFIFLNACQVAAAGTQLSRVVGWPQTFLDAGASACVAPLWSVIDENAKEVATRFYRLVFEEHQTLGEALQQIRVEWKSRRSLTFLSYVLYGDPMARLEWRPGAKASGVAGI